MQPIQLPTDVFWEFPWIPHFLKRRSGSSGRPRSRSHHHPKNAKDRHPKEEPGNHPIAETCRLWRGGSHFSENRWNGLWLTSGLLYINHWSKLANWPQAKRMRSIWTGRETVLSRVWLSWFFISISWDLVWSYSIWSMLTNHSNKLAGSQQIHIKKSNGYSLTWPQPHSIKALKSCSAPPASCPNRWISVQTSQAIKYEMNVWFGLLPVTWWDFMKLCSRGAWKKIEARFASGFQRLYAVFLCIYVYEYISSNELKNWKNGKTPSIARAPPANWILSVGAQSWHGHTNSTRRILWYETWIRLSKKGNPAIGKVDKSIRPCQDFALNASNLPLTSFHVNVV